MLTFFLKIMVDFVLRRLITLAVEDTSTTREKFRELTDNWLTEYESDCLYHALWSLVYEEVKLPFSTHGHIESLDHNKFALSEGEIRNLSRRLDYEYRKEELLKPDKESGGVS